MQTINRTEHRTSAGEIGTENELNSLSELFNPFRFS